MAEANSGASAGDQASRDAEITELKIKCGNYAERCMQLMQEQQTKELAWKEREMKIVKKLEDSLIVIKKLKAQVVLLESKKQVGETHESLQHQVEVVTLQKQNQTLAIQMKSIQAELEMKTILESKKSKLVEMLDAKLAEKAKFTELLMLKIKQKDSKVALYEARIAQLNKLNAEMALSLELRRQQLKKHGIDPGEPFEIEQARKAALERLKREEAEGKTPDSADQTQSKSEAEASQSLENPNQTESNLEGKASQSPQNPNQTESKLEGEASQSLENPNQTETELVAEANESLENPKQTESEPGANLSQSSAGVQENESPKDVIQDPETTLVQSFDKGTEAGKEIPLVTDTQTEKPATENNSAALSSTTGELNANETCGQDGEEGTQGTKEVPPTADVKTDTCLEPEDELANVQVLDKPQPSIQDVSGSQVGTANAQEREAVPVSKEQMSLQQIEEEPLSEEPSSIKDPCSTVADESKEEPPVTSVSQTEVDTDQAKEAGSIVVGHQDEEISKENASTQPSGKTETAT